MSQEETLIHTFYSAFQRGDYSTMQSCYHAQAKFSDPVFQNIDSDEVKAMWQMLLTAARDLKVSFQSVKADGDQGSCSWEAWYTFSRTGRPVHNVITARFRFADFKIIEHVDSFNLWKWSAQALGTSGLMLGWSPLVQNKVRATARQSLDKFMSGQS